MSRLTIQQEQAVLAAYAAKPSSNYVKAQTGHSLATVKRVLARNGIEHTTAHFHKVTEEQLEEAKQRNQAGEAIEAIARSFGVTGPALRDRLVRRGYQPRGCHGQRREQHHGWRGGRNRSGGYVRLLLDPDDPMFSMASVGGYVLEHRLVMARHLGRPLGGRETVHHINGKRDDNRLENLQLRQGRHGNGVVLACAVCGSRDLVEIDL